MFDMFEERDSESFCNHKYDPECNRCVINLIITQDEMNTELPQEVIDMNNLYED
jgi:hypothetical protein